jgi:hypothetical protein
VTLPVVTQVIPANTDAVHKRLNVAQHTFPVFRRAGLEAGAITEDLGPIRAFGSI